MKKKHTRTHQEDTSTHGVQKNDNRGHYVLSLFVVGLSPRSQEAIANTRTLCDAYLKDRYELRVVDICQNPRSASENQIVAAPTLIKMLPLPVKKFVGDMSKTTKILAGLDVRMDERR